MASELHVLAQVAAQAAALLELEFARNCLKNCCCLLMPWASVHPEAVQEEVLAEAPELKKDLWRYC